MIKIANFLHKIAVVFDTQNEFDNYMKEHPSADRSNHSVKSSKEHMDSTLKQYDDNHSDWPKIHVVNAINENAHEWGQHVLKKHNINLTKSDFKKAKKFITSKNSDNPELLHDDKNLDLAIRNILMVKDNKHPNQFNQALEYRKKPEVVAVKNMTPGEKHTLLSHIRKAVNY